MATSFKKGISRAILPLLAVLFFFSCQKDLDYVSLDPSQPADLTTKVNSSVSGFVTDENNLPVLGASVAAGGMTTTTDKYGYFEIKNVQVVQNAAVVTVTQNGYFKGIKTYIAADNKAAFFRIKLIPKTNAGSINAASGGNVTLSNGLIVALPANGVVNAATNAAYTGTVNVAAHWINPTAADLNETMPGDLRGIALDGSLKLLTTYGMAAVELTGSGGELLQIASGKKATLTMNIPASILASAPATIPLWSFDEAKGLWKQEGQATRTGSTYVGEVSHFSFWNCDMPNNYIQLDFTLRDEANNPIAAAYVRLTVVGTSNSATGYTDGAGWVRGAVPPNANLLMEVFTSYNCGSPVYTQNITTGNTNLSLGNITIPTPSNLAVITGTATDCSNAPLTNGRIIVHEGYYYSVYTLSNTGSFSFSRLLCNGTANVEIIAEDLTAMQQSAPVPVTLSVGPNAIGNLQACGINTQEYINFSVDGGVTTTQLLAPGDSVYQSGNGSTVNSFIFGYRNSTPSIEVYFSYSNTGIAVGSTQPLLSFSSNQILGQGATTGSVNITEYGAVGQFIAGTVTGTVVTTTPQTYNIVCSFRVRRNF